MRKGGFALELVFRTVVLDEIQRAGSRRAKMWGEEKTGKEQSKRKNPSSVFLKIHSRMISRQKDRVRKRVIDTCNEENAGLVHQDQPGR